MPPATSSAVLSTAPTKCSRGSVFSSSSCAARFLRFRPCGAVDIRHHLVPLLLPFVHEGRHHVALAAAELLSHLVQLAVLAQQGELLVALLDDGRANFLPLNSVISVLRAVFSQLYEFG